MLLLDASVWVSLVDPGDRFHSHSRTLVLETGQPLTALDLTLYEIANAVGARKGDARGASKLARLVLARCQGAVMKLDLDLVDDTVVIAPEHGLSAYDAAYVAAARRHGWTLVSADIRDLVSKGLAVTPEAAV